MLRLLAFLLLCGTVFAGAPAKKAMRLVDGKAVIGGAMFRSQAMMEVRNLRFYDATLADTGAQCTVAAGELWNMTDGEGWAVDIEIECWAGSKEAGKVGTINIRIERPGKKVPVPFSALLPACYVKQYWDDGCRLMHSVRLRVVSPKPL